MLINWFTVIAQLINFLILVWLLKRFLYKPILKAIDDRENQIATKIKDAEAKKTESEKERDEFQKKSDNFNQLKNEEWNKTLEEIKIKRQKLMEEARTESDILRAKLEKTLKDEQNNLNLVITRKTQDEVLAITSKALKELANESLEQQIVNVFLERLKNLNEEENKKLSDAFSTSKTPLEIITAFDLIKSQQNEIEETMKNLLGTTIKITFKINPESICGIELNANGYKLAWSISEYLNSVEKIISETINAKLQTNKKDKVKEEAK